MRLRELKSITEINLKNLTYIAKQSTTNTNVFIIKDYFLLVQAVENLSYYKLFITITNEIKSIDVIYNSTIPSIHVNKGIYLDFATKIEKLRISCISLIEALEEALPNQDENSVSIKLPDYNSLADIENFTQQLNTILEQSLVNKYIDAEIKLQNFDSGTLWFEIILGSTMAVTFFGSLAWAAAVVRKKIFEGNLLLEKGKALELKTESIKDIVEANKKQLELLIDAETNNLLNQIPDAKEDHEYIARLKNSIKMLAKLIDKGTEIHPALEAPEEVKNLLPDFSKKNTIESKIKLLENLN